MGRKKATSSIVPVPTKVTSRRHARKLTSSYHSLTKRLEAARGEEERTAIQKELEAMGGVKAYQQASALNTALNSTSRWVARALREAFGCGGGRPPIRVLEIGAVNTQLLDTQGFEVRAIDLHALNPRIEQCDFFSLSLGGKFDVERGVAVPYDAVVCSMVLNCVPHERKRFDMLVGIRGALRAGGRAFVTLPSSCLQHSFTLTEASFCDALIAVGLPPLRTAEAASRSPPSSKIVYFECEAAPPDTEAALRFQRARHEARQAHRAALETSRAQPVKSAGAAFDVDVGGNLGQGVRVGRSHAPANAAKAEREQASQGLSLSRTAHVLAGWLAGRPAGWLTH